MHTRSDVSGGRASLTVSELELSDPSLLTC